MAKKKSNKFLKYGIGSVVLLLIIAVGGKKLGIIGGVEEIQVVLEAAEKRTIMETVSASGKIQPEVEVKISPDVSGEIVELYVKEGNKVTKGQILAMIKPDIYQSLMERANASLNTAKANLANAASRLEQAESQFRKTEVSFRRSKKLYDEKVVSSAEYEIALSAYEVAKAEVEAARQSVSGAKFGVASAEASVKEARDNLTKTTIVAPVDGTISKLNVEQGERVVGTSQMAGTEMMRISNLSSMEVSVDVNENDINRVSAGDSAIIEVDAIRDKKFKGIVTEIANSANITGLSADQVTNFTVKVRILSESYRDMLKEGQLSPFRPGLSATVDIQTERVTEVISVPIQAITTRIDSSKTENKFKKPDSREEQKKTVSKENEVPKEYVFLYDGKHKVKQAEVKTGIQDDTYIEVKTGLKKGDEVVVAPYIAVSKKLKDGSEIEKVSKDKLFAEEK